MKRIVYGAAFLALFVGLQTAVGSQFSRDIRAEAERQLEKRRAEENYQELKEATRKLAGLARVLVEEVDRSSEHVISARITESAEKIEQTAKKIEKLAREVKKKAKGP